MKVKKFEDLNETHRHKIINYVISYTRDSTQSDWDMSISSDDLEDLVRKLKSHLSENEFDSIFKIEIDN